MEKTTTIWDVKHITDVSHGGGSQVKLTPATVLDRDNQNKALWPSGMVSGVLTLELPDDVPFEHGQYKITIEKINS
jgi:hypothetical protein